MGTNSDCWEKGGEVGEEMNITIDESKRIYIGQDTLNQPVYVDLTILIAYGTVTYSQQRGN